MTMRTLCFNLFYDNLLLTKNPYSSQIQRLKSKICTGKPRLSEKKQAQKFIDERQVLFIAGDGGDGKSLFHRDKITEYGGPKGGDGGDGGNVTLIADPDMTTLEKMNHFYKAPNGKDGGGFATGRFGKNLYVKVPVGTLLRYVDSYDIEADLSEPGESVTVCVGGLGGKGNKFFASSINTTPQNCTPGARGEIARMVVELKTIANGGLVGFPNAGKSTLLRALSRAKPAVADYPFTTLCPHVGVLHYDDFTYLSIADTPGIIEGAHRNKGLGFKFLKHVERCEFLIYVIDLSAQEPWTQVDILKKEFEHYNIDLTRRPSLVLANKIDLTDAMKAYDQFERKVQADNPDWHVMPVSGMKRQYLDDVIERIRYIYDNSVLTQRLSVDTNSSY